MTAKAYFFLFFLLFYSFVNLFSQEGLPLQFKTKNLFVESYKNDFENLGQHSKLKSSNRYYFIIQFDKIPDEQVKQKLGSLYNVFFAHYLPTNAFYCYSLKPVPSSDFVKYHIRSISALESNNKIDNSLTINIPDHIKMLDGKLQIAISVYDDENLEIHSNFISAQGFEVRKISSYKKIIHVTVDPKKLNDIAQLPFVLWMEGEAASPFVSNLPGLNNHRANLLNYSGLGGRNLHGDSVVIGEGDDGLIQPHFDHTPRLFNYHLTQNSDHPDHVAGTIIGAGNIDPYTKGMADESTILADYFNAIQDDVPTFYSAFNMVLTSNSWGSTSGCSSTGQYTASSNAIDQQLRNYPKLLHVFAASNDGASNCSPYTAGYRTIGSNENCAKNVLTVGALSSTDLIASFSSRGPCLDGRIKPEVCAVGVSVYSTVRTNTYSTKNGTSMATPGVSGTLALLEQRYRQLHSYADADGALLKALIANTADDVGTSGPDFYYGFGRINGRKAVECLEANRYQESAVSQNDSIGYVIAIPAGVSQLKVMLYWNDKEGSPSASYSLVNNLDLKVYDPSSTLYLPWVLDYSSANCALAATRKTDTLNNIEQVTITNPTSGNYTLVIRGTSVPFGPQDFKLVYDYYSPAVKLTYPIGGEKLVAGGSETIYWDNTGITSGTFTLSYSSDSCATYTNIATGISYATNSYTWTPIPTIASSKCFVKITHSGGVYLDSSYAKFTISGRPGSFAISACDKQARLSWAAVSGASGYQIYMIDTNLSGTILAVKQVSGTSTSISPITNGKDYWFSVAAVFSDGSIGQRAIALKTTPSASSCNDVNDVGITAIIAPTSGRMNTSTQLSATQSITVTIKNFSSSGIASIPINYSVNGGAVVTETYGGTVAANSTYNYTFTATADFSATGNYSLKCYTTFAGDPNASNDTLSISVKHIVNNAITMPFLENMEGCSQTSLTGSFMGVSGMESADFTNSTVLGRARFALGSGYSSSGANAAVLDKAISSAVTNINYLTYTFNLSSYTGAAFSPTLTFNFTHFGEESNSGDSVWIRGDDTQPFVPVYSLFQNKPAVGVYKTSSLLNLKNLLTAAGQTISSSFQIRFGQQDDSSAFSNINTDGFAFDDINIFDLNSDVSLDSITSLSSACALSASSKIIFKITNNSASTQTNIPVAYTINGGSIIRDTVPSIAANTTITDTFSTNADLSVAGEYLVKAWSEWATDQYQNNDTFDLGVVYNYGLISTFPYKQNFESTSGNWISGIKSGSHNSWAWGTPSKTNISSAGSGSKCWVTSLNSVYPSNEESYLQSPCLDFSSLSNPKISFMINFVTESTWDCVILERSINGGTTWQRVDSSNNTKLYNALAMQSGCPPAPVWSNTSSSWKVYQFPLTGMNGQSNCKLRFRFFSDGGVVDEGVAIDSIVIYEKLTLRSTAGDYTITSSTPTFKGSEWIDVADANENIIFSINPNGNNLGSTSWGIRINNGTIRTDTVEVGASKYFGYYLDRNFFIHPQTQPSSSVDLRFYVPTSEMQNIKDSIFNKYARTISNDSIDITKESTASTNLDPTIHTGSTAFARLNTSSSSYDSDLYLQIATTSFSKFNPSFVPLNTGYFLPVRWLNVSAKWVNDIANINWWVAQEVNVDYYEIEFSIDGLKFETIGAVQLNQQLMGNGNYFFNHPWKENYTKGYYRIKEVDYNGKISNSNIVSLAGNFQATIFPIPAYNKINVKLSRTLSENMTASCFDLKGVKYFQVELNSGQKEFSMDIYTLTDGVYFLRFSDPSIKPIRFEVLKR